MARVFRRPWVSPDGTAKLSPWYSLDFKDPVTGRRVIRQTHPLTSSKRIATEQLHAALVGGTAAGGGPTAKKVLDRYGDYLSTHHETTWRSCGGRVRWWAKALGEKAAEEVTPGDIEAAMATLPEKLAEATRAGYMVVVTAAFRQAIRDRLIRNDPTVGVGLKFGYPERRVLWTDQELAAVCEVSPAYLASILRLLRTSGLRIGDCLALRWSDIDGDRIRVRQIKTRDVLDVPLRRTAVAVLEAVPKKDGQPLVFPGPRGTARAYNRVLRTFEEARGEVAERMPAVAEKTLHDLRRTFATELLDAGLSLEHVAQFLGQTTTRIAGRYTVKRFEALRALIA